MWRLAQARKHYYDVKTYCYLIEINRRHGQLSRLGLFHWIAPNSGDPKHTNSRYIDILDNLEILVSIAHKVDVLWWQHLHPISVTIEPRQTQWPLTKTCTFWIRLRELRKARAEQLKAIWVEMTHLTLETAYLSPWSWSGRWWYLGIILQISSFNEHQRFPDHEDLPESTGYQWG